MRLVHVLWHGYVTEKYRAQIHRSLEHRTLHGPCGVVCDECICVDSSWVVHLRQANSHLVLPAFLKYLPSLYLPEMHNTIDSIWKRFTAVTPVFCDYHTKHIKWGVRKIQTYRSLGHPVYNHYPGVDGRMILRWIFRNWDVGSWTGSSWIRIGTGGRHCECCNEPSGSI